MRINVTISYSRNCNNQEVKHVMKLIFSLWNKLILDGNLLLFSKVLLFNFGNFQDVLIFNSKHHRSKNNNCCDEYIEKAEPDTRKSERSSNKDIVHSKN